MFLKVSQSGNRPVWRGHISLRRAQGKLPCLYANLPVNALPEYIRQAQYALVEGELCFSFRTNTQYGALL
jgi:hypothetical protein